jgi:hypothetical protein
MKRPAQLARLVVVAALALLCGQPLLAYASCARQSCSDNACPPVCCADMAGMAGMHHEASMHAMAGCVSLMEALPASSGCGQSAPSVAVVSSDAAPSVSAADGNRALGGAALTSLLSIGTPPSTATRLHSSGDPREVPDRGVLFHVFRI